MSIIDKIKEKFIIKKPNIIIEDNKITFLQNKTREFILYYLADNDKYVLVADKDFSYGKNSLDKEWIYDNKQNFAYYEEFEAIQEVMKRYKEISREFASKNISYNNDNECKIEQAKSLPKGWEWVIYDDYSGHLKSPNQEEYFSFDWTTREYKITSDDHYSFFGNYYDLGKTDDFSDFQKCAENYIKEKLIEGKSIENKIKIAQEKSEIQEKKQINKNKKLEQEV